MTFHPKIEKTSEFFEVNHTASFLKRHMNEEGPMQEFYDQK